MSIFVSLDLLTSFFTEEFNSYPSSLSYNCLLFCILNSYAGFNRQEYALDFSMSTI